MTHRLPRAFSTHTHHDRSATSSELHKLRSQFIAFRISKAQHFCHHRSYDTVRAILKNIVHFTTKCLPVDVAIVVIRKLKNGEDAGEHGKKG